MRDVTRQQQQFYVNVWQTGPVKIKECTETAAYHYSLRMLQYSTAVDAVCTKQPDGAELHLINTKVQIQNIPRKKNKE